MMKECVCRGIGKVSVIDPLDVGDIDHEVMEDCPFCFVVLNPASHASPPRGFQSRTMTVNRKRSG